MGMAKKTEEGAEGVRYYYINVKVFEDECLFHVYAKTAERI